ncbi:MAG: hypothetical protein ACP5R2_01050 [Anaerolineae bacterium]
MPTVTIADMTERIRRLPAEPTVVHHLVFPLSEREADEIFPNTATMPFELLPAFEDRSSVNGTEPRKARHGQVHKQDAVSVPSLFSDWSIDEQCPAQVVVTRAGENAMRSPHGPMTGRR